MLPPWMNLYAILTMATVLASIVGVVGCMAERLKEQLLDEEPVVDLVECAGS